MFVCLFVSVCWLVGFGIRKWKRGTSGLYSAYFLQILTHFCFRLGGLRGESRSHKQPPQQYQLSSAFPALLVASEPHYQRDAVGCSDTSADTESQSAEARSKDCNRDREIEIERSRIEIHSRSERARARRPSPIVIFTTQPGNRRDSPPPWRGS